MLTYFKWFAQYWKQHAWKMWGVLLLTVVTIGLKTYFPIVLKNVIDAMQSDFQIDSVVALIWIYLGVGLLHEIFSRLLPLSRAYMNLTLSLLIRTNYYKRFTQKRFHFFQKYQTGDLLTRLTDDIDGQWDRIEWYSCSGVMRPIEAALILLFTLGVMFYYSWQLTLWSFLPIPFLLFLLSVTQDKMVQYTSAKQKAISECNNYLETCFSGIRVVKSTLSEQDQLKKYEQALENRIQREKDFLRMNQLIHFFSLLVNHTGSLIVLFVGGYLTIQKKLELGTFLLFIIYLERLIEPIWTLSWFYASSKQVFTYVDRLKETDSFASFELAPTPVTSSQSASTYAFQKLDFQNVSFSYEKESPEPVLQKVSFSVKPKEVVALVGPIGAGKTTILELLMQNLQPDQGEILLNGIPLQSYSLEERARFFGYVQQESLLFSDTIQNNLHLGNSIEEDDLKRAIDTAQLHKELEQFPQKLETFLGHRGISLSGGQKQRVSLARTLCRQPQLLLLDDCTSAMDAVTEARFWRAFKKNYPNTACLVVTHRQATANQADKVIRMEYGKSETVSCWENETP